MKKGRLRDLNRNELVSLCRYYHGEEENPYTEVARDNRPMLWYCERSWVNDMIKSRDGDTEVLEEYLNTYIAAGLTDFKADDGIPMKLKSYLFSVYMKGESTRDTEPFKKFYLKYY